jgi:hypothetical protein
VPWTIEEAMDNIDKLIEKLRKVEALRHRGATIGERAAAEAAHKALLARLEQLREAEPPVEQKFTFADSWSRRLFSALCRHFGLEPYRYKGQRYTTVMLSAPTKFVDEELWPMYLEYSDILEEHLDEVTQQVIARVFEEQK